MNEELKNIKEGSKRKKIVGESYILVLEGERKRERSITLSYRRWHFVVFNGNLSTRLLYINQLSWDIANVN